MFPRMQLFEMARPLHLTLIFLLAIKGALSLECYHLSGNLNKDQNVVPCDPTVKGTAGSHSSCCNKGTGDQCLSTGLCLATNAKVPNDLFWINGCTDKTWRDPACPQYCNPPENPTANTGHPRLKMCANGTRYCCLNYYANETECCDHTFTLARGVGTLIAHLTDDTSSSTRSTGPGASSTSTSVPGTARDQSETQETPKSNQSPAAAITGGVLGTALVAALVGLVFLWLQNRKLSKEVEEKRKELEENQKQQQLPAGARMAEDNKPYQPYYPAEPYGTGMLAVSGYGYDMGVGGNRVPAYTPELPTTEGRIGQLP